jgi:hypothetical protein
MHFEDNKLLPEAVDTLFQCSIESVRPYVLMLAPVYVFMKRNEKFVSVKAPLDFFTSDELEKLKVYGVFYMPKFVKLAVRFETAARLVKNLFSLAASADSDTNNETDPDSSAQQRKSGLPPAPFELSNETLKLVGRLWGKELKIEPFFMAVFAHELCGVLNSDLLLQSREKAVMRHDWGLLLSGAFVFVAVQLGYWDLETLIELRNQIYTKTVEGEQWTRPSSLDSEIVCDLSQHLKGKKDLSADDLENFKGEWARRLKARLVRVKKTMARTAESSPSIYGEEGFAA